MVCAVCGVIIDIEPLASEATSSGVGAVAGAVAGGLLGNQIGGGSGKKLATIGGAVGGAVAGNEIEKRRRNAGGAGYRISVDMDAGGVRTIIQPDAAGLRVGAPVRVLGDQVLPR